MCEDCTDAAWEAYGDLLSMMRDKVRDWELGLQPASVVMANIKDILAAEEV